jgi:integrase
MLSRDVQRYVTLRRTLGHKFGDQARSLELFANYATAHGDQFVRVERVLEWAKVQTPSALRRYTLVGRVRRFALAMHAENPRYEIPPKDCMGRVNRVRKPPHIYTAGEIESMMRAARQMPAERVVAPLTITTLLGLLASTGLRISEALTLQCSDLTDDGLLIRKSKNNKTRLIPLHDTTRTALETYLKERARRPVYTQAVFVSSCGQALPYHSVRGSFLRVLARARLRPMSARTGPRMHDLRHTFAVRSLAQCQHNRKAVGQHIVALSTYLGHPTLSETYWYLEATPMIMSGIAKAGESMHRGGNA